MGAIEHLTIGVPVDIADKLRAWVASGEFGSMEAVVLDRLLGLEGPETGAEYPAITTWLRTEVAQIYDRMKADPSRGIPIEQVIARLKAERIARGE
ncbi:type II toxin-antitoxin system ParD family antitoxin [Sphingomonas bacterium]|uniref:type II toxin-antitoxin system ParD family antitoxin n=1 Tax=Sphingomonas bacterium TaxID=1895847 RepID=UPI001575895B|nr:type II toxin-antitoxin system ParD family antitoxin [Sphingomonas bacterium]